MEAYATRTAEQYRKWLNAKDGSIDPLEARDANNECQHGRLPGDPTCGCWR